LYFICELQLDRKISLANEKMSSQYCVSTLYGATSASDLRRIGIKREEYA